MSYTGRPLNSLANFQFEVSSDSWNCILFLLGAAVAVGNVPAVNRPTPRVISKLSQDSALKGAADAFVHFAEELVEGARDTLPNAGVVLSADDLVSTASFVNLGLVAGLGLGL